MIQRNNNKERAEDIKEEIRQLKNELRFIKENDNDVTITFGGKYTPSNEYITKVIKLHAAYDITTNIERKIKQLEKDYKKAISCENEITTYEQLKKYVGKPILMGYHDYPDNCYAWMGVLEQIGSDEEQKNIKQVVKELEQEIGPGYVTYFDLHTADTAEMYDNGLVPAKKDEFEWWWESDYTRGTDADWIRIPTKEELENYWKKAKMIRKEKEKWKSGNGLTD